MYGGLPVPATIEQQQYDDRLKHFSFLASDFIVQIGRSWTDAIYVNCRAKVRNLENTGLELIGKILEAHYRARVQYQFNTIRKLTENPKNLTT